MSGFHSRGNNNKKMQFLQRVGSYSTHGSRKGFADYGEDLTTEQFEDPTDSYEILKTRIAEYGEYLRDFRERNALSKKVRLVTLQAKALKGNAPNIDLSEIAHAVAIAKEHSKLQLRLSKLKKLAGFRCNIPNAIVAALKSRYPLIFEELHDEVWRMNAALLQTVKKEEFHEQITNEYDGDTA